MTWTKLGDEFGDAARVLTDAEFRTHVEALGWSNRRGLDLIVPVDDLKRFAESPAAEKAAAGLVDKGWWEEFGPRNPSWFIGLHFPEWQLERSVVEHRRDLAAMRQRRHRMHVADDHRMCQAGRCPHVTRDVTRDPGRYGSVRDGGLDPKDQSQSLRRMVGAEGDDAGGSGGTASPPAAVAGGSLADEPAPSQSLRDHDGPEPDGPDVQHDSIEVHRQSQATGGNAREAAAIGAPNGTGPKAP
jgi:hypothetical protein